MSDPLMPQLNTLACAWTRARIEQRCLAAMEQHYEYWIPETLK